jgi:hypothetical protein
MEDSLKTIKHQEEHTASQSEEAHQTMERLQTTEGHQRGLRRGKEQTHNMMMVAMMNLDSRIGKLS